MRCDRSNRRRFEQLDECRRAQDLEAGVAHAIGGQMILDDDIGFGSQSLSGGIRLFPFDTAMSGWHLDPGGVSEERLRRCGPHRRRSQAQGLPQCRRLVRSPCTEGFLWWIYGQRGPRRCSVLLQSSSSCAPAKERDTGYDRLLHTASSSLCKRWCRRTYGSVRPSREDGAL